MISFRFPCEKCKCKGWVMRAGREWPELCPVCGGRWKVDLVRLTKERSRTLLRIWEGRARAEVCRRVLDRLHIAQERKVVRQVPVWRGYQEPLEDGR